MRKTILSIFFALAASVGTLFAENGTCGDNLIWDLTDGVLTISGTGDMTNWDEEAPWRSYRENITSVTIGNSVTSIGDYAFWNCFVLTSITIPNSVTSIGNYAFAYCDGLMSVTIPNSVTNIGDRAFSGCTGLTSMTLPNSVTSIGGGAFAGCTGLTSPVYNAHVFAYMPTSYSGAYTIPDGIEFIARSAFYECSGLTRVTIGNNVTSIGNAAFSDCSGLTSVTFPNSVTSIGNNAFVGCSSLTSVTIPNSVTSIGYYAFSDCSGMTSINVATDNPNYCSANGVLFNKDKTTLIQYPGGKSGAYTIPNSVTSIEHYAFAYCTGLTSVTIGNSVTSIGYSAFSSCSSLTSVTIGNSVTSIGDYAFVYCPGLTSVTIPNSVTSIGIAAFAYCTGLTSVTIGNSVTSIGESAFDSCSGLTNITCKAVTPPTCEADVFYNVYKAIPLYVPANSIDAYKAADQWKDFGDNIQPIQATESTVTEIVAIPTDNSVVIEWPAVNEATEYIIQIWKGDELICALSFNGQGQLLSISFEKKAGNGTAKTATQTATGWQYTIGGLDFGTEYTYTVVAKNGEEELFNESKQFTTTIATAVDEISTVNSQLSTKFFRDGILYITCEGVLYNAQGARVD